MSGVLIVLDGPDGGGKSTAHRTLVSRLRATGHHVVASREPTNGPFGAALRAAALRGTRYPVANELALFEADRREHVQRVIAPALAAGRVVVLDRYYHAGAYQSVRPGAPSLTEIIARSEAFAPRPDLVLLLTLPVEVALARIPRPDAFERVEELRKVAAAYGSLEGHHVVRIDATRGPEEVAAACWEVVRGLLG